MCVVNRLSVATYARFNGIFIFINRFTSTLLAIQPVKEFWISDHHEYGLSFYGTRCRLDDSFSDINDFQGINVAT